MPEVLLPKWTELNTNERHKLLGELIDAMIYSEEAVLILRITVEEFRKNGWVRSVILPESEN
jgi:hypothetical protein